MVLTRQFVKILLLPLRFNFQRCFSSTSEFVKVRFVSSEGVHEVPGKIGDTLLDVVENNDVPLDGFGACGGTLACCSCHVILEKSHYDRLKPPDEEEMDMLDLTPHLEEHSRLGCQVKLAKQDFPEVTVKVPSVIVDARTMG